MTMDTHILKEKSELFVFPLIFTQIAKLLTEHDLSWAFPTAYCYFYCHCQLSFPYQELSLDEEVLISQTHTGTPGGQAGSGSGRPQVPLLVLIRLKFPNPFS